MPAPIMPAPSTVTFLASDLGTPAGRTAPLSSSCLDRNSERIIALAWGVISVLTK